MGIRVRLRAMDEPTPPREEIERRAGLSVEDYIKVALDIDALTAGSYRASIP